MLSGGKPIPTALVKLHGKPGHAWKENKREPKPEGDLCEPPDWLTDAQKIGWEYAIRNAPAGLLKMCDRAVLVMWVVSEDLHRLAAIKIHETGLMVRLKEGTAAVRSPHIKTLNEQAATMLRCISELGFSPSARPRIKMPDADADDPGAALRNFLDASSDENASPN